MPMAVADRTGVPCQFLLGRLSAREGTGLSVDRPFVGQMDEVALYDVHAGTTARSAVLSEFTANRPKPSSYPYLWEGHTVVLAYDQGTRYRLIRLTPDAVVPGVVQAFR